MYEAHFGISAPPFQLSPDPAFYFDSRIHHATLETLRGALAAPGGHVIVSGEVGAGKTLLLGTLLGELASPQVVVGRVVSTQLDADGLIRAALNAFGVDRGTLGLMLPTAALSAYLTTLAGAGRRAILFVDEAQNLEPDAVHRLIEVEARGAVRRDVLKVCLVGQPELRDRLASGEIVIPAERVAVHCHLGPLDAEETGAYILHRLVKVGWAGAPQFEREAFAEIHRWTGGVPRRINQLCNRLMLAAYLNDEPVIDRALVEATAGEQHSEIGGVAPLPRKPAPSRADPPRGDLPRLTLVLEPTDLAMPPPVPPPPRPPEALVLNLSAESLVPATSRLADGPTQAPAAAKPGAKKSAEATAVRVVEPPAPPETPRLESGCLLLVAAGVGDHVKAAALLRVCRRRPALPPAMLLRAYANDALERTRPLFDGVDPSRIVELAVPADAVQAERGALLSRRAESLLTQHRPAAVLVFDGSDAALAIGLVARKLGLPVLAVGAGRRAAETDAPAAGLASKLVEQVADVLYTADVESSEQLVRDGVAYERVVPVGSLLVDGLRTALHAPKGGDVFDGLPPLVSELAAQPRGYGAVMVGARSNIADRRSLVQVVNLLTDVSRDLPLIWPLHPFTHAQLLKFRLDGAINAERILCLPLLPYATYAYLLANATCVLTDAWGVQEEATALEVPCLTIGNEPAFPLTVSMGSNVAIGNNRSLATSTVWNCLFSGGKRGHVPPLWDAHAAERVADHVALYLAAAQAARA